MTARDFCFWIQGKLEIDSAKFVEGSCIEPLTLSQIECIKHHLALVFIHDIDPKIDKGNAVLKAALDSAHFGKLQAFPESTPRC